MKHLFIVILSVLISVHLYASEAIYTVLSTHSVDAVGAPKGSTYSFEQTGTQKERMTAGNSTTLHLTGYGKSTIKAICLSMKSNTKSGSGSLELTIGNQSVWTIDNQPFSSNQWYGQYTTSYVEIVKMLFLDDFNLADDVNLYIESTANSLYINQIKIIYSGNEPTPDADNPDNPYQGDTTQTPTGDDVEVRFETQISDIDFEPLLVKVGSGVRVPSIDYSDGYWTFEGWTDKLYDSTITIWPYIVFPDEIIYPTENTIYYAIYRHRDYLLPAEQLADGRYVIYKKYIANYYTFYSLYDTIHMGLIGSDLQNFIYSAPIINDNSIFRLQILSDSTLYLMQSSKYVRYASRKLSLSASPFEWHYLMADAPNHIHLQIIRNGEYLEIASSNNDNSITLYPTDLTNQTYLSFYQIPEQYGSNIRTNYPQGKPTNLHNQPFADIQITQTSISNPNRLYINIYSCLGQLVGRFNSECIDISFLPSGMYVVSTTRNNYKFIK